MKAQIITRTERLLIREFCRDDAVGLYELNSDPDVMRYTGDTAFSSPAQANQFIQSYGHYQHHGFGRWSVLLQNCQTFIGYCGLRRNETSNEVDLGFKFFREHWAKGYATEAGKATLKIGFEQYNLDHIIGRAMSENRASISVLQKLGMIFREFTEEDQGTWLIYELRREHFSVD